jgi:putative chitinase
MSGETFERQKYELEKQKLEFERTKYERDSTFFNKNFGVIITGLVSIATIVVSGSGILISSNYNATQLANARSQGERSFSFDVAKFMLERREDISTTDTLKAGYARNVVIALFPQELSTQISERMRDLADDQDVKKVWADGLVYARAIATLPTPAVRTPNTLTVEQLLGEFQQLNAPAKVNELKLLLSEAQKNKITDKNDVALFLTSIFHETGFLELKVENLNYSASRLMLVWPARFTSTEQAREYEKNPQKLANFVYANRAGNSDPDDGFKFRSRGYLGTFGRAAYAKLGQEMGIDLVSNPDKLLEPPVGARAAAIEFARVTEQQRKNGKLDLVQTSRALSGGVMGLDSKRAIYERIQKL